MTRQLKGVKEKFGRCFIEKSEALISTDLKKTYIIIGEQVGYVVLGFLAGLKSNMLAWMSEPVYLENLHIYHVSEDDTCAENTLVWIAEFLLMKSVDFPFFIQLASTLIRKVVCL